MAKIIAFYKKYWVIILLAFIATSLLLIKIFLVNEAPLPSPTPQSKIEMYKGVVPGKTTTQELAKILGAPDPKQSDFTKNTLAYPREGGGPDHQAITDGDQTVLLFKQKALSGNIKDYVDKNGKPDGEYFGDNASVGYKLYVWASQGFAIEASVNDGLIFEIWYFQPTTKDEFLKNWGGSLTTELKPDNTY